MLNKVLRSVLALGLIVGVSSLAVAQYGGGGGMGGGGMPGNPAYNPNRSYSNKGAIIGGVAGGAAAIGGLLYWRHHKRARLQGSVSGNGDKLVSEKDNHTYSLTNMQTHPLKCGESVELVDEKVTDARGEPTFEVHTMNKDLGLRTASIAENP